MNKELLKNIKVLYVEDDKQISVNFCDIFGFVLDSSVLQFWSVKEIQREHDNLFFLVTEILIRQLLNRIKHRECLALDGK